MSARPTLSNEELTQQLHLLANTAARSNALLVDKINELYDDINSLQRQLNEVTLRLPPIP